MSASNPSLHPLRQSIGPGEIQFTLRGAAAVGEDYAVECEYQPRREWDVKKTRHFGLLGSWMGAGSRELLKTQREEFHHFRQHFTAANADMSFTAPLRDPAAGYEAYQLATVKIVGHLTGTIEFGRWSEHQPSLDAGFGLKCEPAALGGVIRPSGLGAQPLRGSLPLWPGLRRVDAEFRSVKVPILRVFDALQKHHWDGWRQTTPQSWPGGKSTVVRHTNAPTVWRENEYDPFPAAHETPVVRPLPPAGIQTGVQLEVFWPRGDTLDFPETRFDGDVEMISVPSSKLPAQAAERLAESVRLRPGVEHGSLSAQEWKELEDSLPEAERPLDVQMVPANDGRTTLRIGRKPGFTEPWICILCTPYDERRRFIVTSILLKPDGWTGPVPE